MKTRPLNIFICHPPWSFRRVLTSSYLRLWTICGQFYTGSEASFAVIHLEKPPSVSSINGKILSGSVQFSTAPLSLHIGALHEQKISFYVLPKSSCTLLLGLLWLHSHALVIDWSSGEVIRWGKQCLTSCIFVPRSSVARMSSVKSPIPAPPGLPAPYADFADVFCKKKAESLPPHRP